MRRLPNELQIPILVEVLNVTSYSYLVTLQQVCTKWKQLISLIIHETVYDRIRNDMIIKVDLFGDYKASEAIVPQYNWETKVFDIHFDLDDSNSLKLVHPLEYCPSCGETIQVYFGWKESAISPGLEIESLVYAKVIENPRYEFISQDNMAMTILSKTCEKNDSDNDNIYYDNDDAYYFSYYNDNADYKSYNDSKQTIMLSLESIKVPVSYLCLAIDQLDGKIPQNNKFINDPNIYEEKKTIHFGYCNCDSGSYYGYMSDEYRSDDDYSFDYDDYDRFDD